MEGHGKIVIFLDEEGNVENAYLQIPELRGFEKFCEGRRAEDMPQITSRICGVCPVAHHTASVKALDDAFNTDPTPTAKKLRELAYCGYIIYDHIMHFYFLGAPDFFVGIDAPPHKRNIFGLIEKTGLKIGKEVIKHRAYGQRIVEIIGGKATHPVHGLPGGVSKPISEEERREIEKMLNSCLDFAKFSIELFDKFILGNEKYVEMIKSDPYSLRTYNMGLVDEKNRLNFYDGKIRVVDQKGKELLKFDVRDYQKYIAEHVEEWSYVKFPYLKEIGWIGLKDGEKSGIYRVGPLGRLNASDSMATPLANEEFRRMFKELGRPVNSTLAYHWARLIEILYAAERGIELIQDPEITSKDIRNPIGKPGEGFGVVEAARGVLIHHYKISDNGLIEKANFIVATTSNAGAIAMSVREAARALIKNGKVEEGLLNRIEMAFRAYDPCLACASHAFPGGMPLEVDVYNKEGKLVRVVKRD